MLAMRPAKPPRGEGACSRSAAQQPQNRTMQFVWKNAEACYSGQREQAPSPQGLVSSRISSPTPPTVGAGLLAKAAAQLASVLNVSPRASPPHPTRGVHKYCIQPNSPVGASLLAKAAGQLASVLNVSPRATAHTSNTGCSQILHPTQLPCGSELARESGGSACISTE